ncbi:MAG: Uma2 family endonuclease [Thiolinea sp.]
MQSTIIASQHRRLPQGELISEIRHEYIEVRFTPWRSRGERHNLISGNLFAALRSKARAFGCKLFMADMKLRIRALKRFYYPDLLLTCNQSDGHEYYKEYPCLVIEVMSPSTEGTDRREKLQAYQSIPSLQEYVLVAQERRQIEIYRRDDERWQHITLDADDPVYFSCLDLELSMAQVYEDVL